MSSMEQKMEDIGLSRQDLFDNNANRIAVCICIDVSYSMRLQHRIEHVNKGVRKFIEDSRENIYTADSLDLCIIAFGGKGARIIQPFDNIKNITWKDLVTDGGETPMGQAVSKGLEEISKRRESYSANGIPSYKPCLIIMSDGEASDDISRAADTAREMMKNKKVRIYCIDLSNGTEKNSLSRFSPDGETEGINALQIEEFFLELSKSAVHVSTSGAGENEMRGPNSRNKKR